MPKLLSLRSISKRFPGVHALKSVDFEVCAGECVALLGENGAGKSTLIKVLGGAYAPDDGLIELDGEEVSFGNPNDSLSAGIAVIYQEFNLVPELSAAENIFLGIEPNDFGFVKRRQQFQKAREILSRLGAKIDPNRKCELLTIAEKQLVEIAKAMVRDARILIMDEPSAALTNNEVEQLYQLVDELKSEGIAVVYVSHRLEEVERLADRAVVMRDGERVGELQKTEIKRSKIIEMMVGRSMDAEFPANVRNPGSVRFRVKDLSRGDQVRKVSFELRGGEILALTGLVGAGRTEAVRLLFGADRLESGSIELDGVRINPRNPKEAISQGICLLTEDRKDQGLVLCLSVRDNFALPNLEKFSRYGWLNGTKEDGSYRDYEKSIRIKCSGSGQLVRHLSGGNQQKVVLAKWLERNAEVLIFDEPTRGIDVGAKYEIYEWMNRLAVQGKCILMISSELPEVLGMSDRILVMRGGCVVGEVENSNAVTQESLMELAIGGKKPRNKK